MAEVLKISLLGTMPGGEEWSVNPVYRISGAGDIIASAEGTAIVTGINALTIPAGVRAMANSTTFHSGVRVEARFLNGDLEGIFEGLRAAPLQGTSSQTHPFQCATVSSLQSLTPGPSGRGRLFWPATGAVLLNTTLRIDPAQLATYLTGIKDYLTAIEGVIETVLGVPVGLAVWSRKNAATSPVTTLRVGDVVDTQRRRRDTLPESYLATAY